MLPKLYAKGNILNISYFFQDYAKHFVKLGAFFASFKTNVISLNKILYRLVFNY